MQSVNRISALTSGEALGIKNKLLAMRDKWVLHPDTIYTLGFPTYKTEERRNQLEIVEENSFLNETFGWLYGHLISACSEMLGEKVYLDPMIPFPGFHIFSVCSGREQYPAAPIHSDESFRKVGGLEDCIAKQGDHWSVVLPISVPETGTATDFFEPDPDKEGVSRSFEESHLYCLSAEHITGELIVFDSFWPHRISAFELSGSDDFRITFQSHLAKRNNKWILYW